MWHTVKINVSPLLQVVFGQVEMTRSRKVTGSGAILMEILWENLIVGIMVNQIATSTMTGISFDISEMLPNSDKQL